MIKEKLLQSNFYKFEYVVDGKKVGRAFLFIIYNDLHQKPYGLLEDVFVEEKYRGRGIGKELVKRVIKKAKEIGCYKLIATSRFEREMVHKLYESLGFKKWGYEFRLDLE
jgi:GNAT superfamily N-acetyltransferase